MNRRTRDGLKIGEAARASGLSTKTIRYYEEVGLIPKARRRNAWAAPHTGGARIYGEEDVARLRFIRDARRVDLGLADIRSLLQIAEKEGCPSEHPAYREVLKRHVRRMDDQINRLLGQRTAVQKLLDRKWLEKAERCSWNTCSCMQADTARSASTGHDKIQGDRANA